MLFEKRLSRLLPGIGMAGFALCLSGCIDKDYDLSDIDSTAQVKIDNLVLPLNMKPVELGDIISADPGSDPDGSEFRYDDITGDYYLISTGDYSSDPIKIGGIYAAEPTPASKTITFPAVKGTSDLAALPGVVLSELNYDFSYTYQPVNRFIEAIDVATLDHLTMGISIATSNSMVTLDDVKFHLPEGMFCSVKTTPSNLPSSYDFETGVLSIGGGFQKADVTVVVDSINVAQAGGSLDRDADTFVFANNIGLTGARVTSEVESASEQIVVGYNLSDLEITALSGKISYDLEVDDTNISLEDLPEELRQEGTNLTLINPQLYLNVSNPFSANGVYVQTDLDVYQVREGKVASSSVASLNKFNLGGNAEKQLPVQSVCLSPEKPQNPFETFDVFHTFSGLGSVVAGDGLPDELMVRLTNTRVPSGTEVKSFPIGRDRNDVVEGTYSFYAPLALQKGSVIYYTSKTNDWDIDDADELYIDMLEVSADVTSNVPLSVELSALPLNQKGEEMTHVKVEPATLAADGSSKVVIRITALPGTSIVGIDGLEYTAKVTAGDSEQNLNKNMKLVLDNIKVKVNGYYQTKL